MSAPTDDGWPWIDAAGEERAADQLARDVHVALTATSAGERLRAWLRSVTIDQPVPPTQPSAAVWHREGQRALVLALERMINRVEKGEA